MFKVEFDTCNAAFRDPDGDPGMDGYYEAQEICRILDEIKMRIELAGAADGVCMDINGNKVGEWSR